MEDIKLIISKNLTDLRKEKKLTQLELAEKLNYSDKAVSRWEHGDTLPDIEVLCKICEIYGVTFDYLIHDGTPKEKKHLKKHNNNPNKLMISLLSISAVWFVATMLFVILKVSLNIAAWQCFVWAIPVSCIVAIVFNSIWGKRNMTFVISSILTWSTLASIFFQFLQFNLWPLFIIGVPLQISIILAQRIKFK